VSALYSEIKTSCRKLKIGWFVTGLVDNYVAGMM